MTPLAFFRSHEVQSAIRRAARIAGCPISIHVIREGEESPRVLSTGGCAVCRVVCEVSEGRDACRQSRAPRGTQALRRTKPVPFVCHLGFACVSIAPLAEVEQPYVLTLGPYCATSDRMPASAGHAYAATERSVQHGLAKLDLDADEEPMEDVGTSPADVVAGIAEWLAELLLRLWQERESSEGHDQERIPDERPSTAGRTARPEPDPYGASAIAAALVAGDRAAARKLIGVSLGETRGTTPAHGAARLIGLAGAILEGVVRAGARVDASWDSLIAQLGEMSARENPKEWPRLLARLLSPAVSGPEIERLDLVAQVDSILDGRVADAPSLGEVAAALECTPSAITHALQRKFGMSFTQYVGRLRVAAAKDLLRRTKLSPAEVGRRIGIDDTSNFARLFKKFEGITPVEYRARFGAKR